MADIIDTIADEPYEAVVNRVILRTMKKAYYSPECDGHFGLAFRYYCHFTSPIRRYPDLDDPPRDQSSHQQSHDGSKAEKSTSARCAGGSEEISSRTERKAQELEREVEKSLKNVSTMLDHIDEEYDGIVSGVTEFRRLCRAAEYGGGHGVCA